MKPTMAPELEKLEREQAPEPELEPEPEPEPQPEEDPHELVQWRAVQRAVIRSGVEQSSEKLGNLELNEIFGQLERVVTEAGIVRVRLHRGWVSVTSSDGFPLCVREDSIQELLTSVPLLKSLDESEREAVAEALGYETYEYGEAIVEQGDDGDEVSCAYLAALFPR